MALNDKTWDEYDHEAWAELLAARDLTERTDCPFAYVLEESDGIEGEQNGTQHFFHTRQEMVSFALTYERGD